jgi:hypothetical protein
LIQLGETHCTQASDGHEERKRYVHRELRWRVPRLLFLLIARIVNTRASISFHEESTVYVYAGV